MYHQPKPQDQARILKAALGELNLGIKHQDALSIVARMMGYPSVHVMAAAATDAEVERQNKARILGTVQGPADGNLYEALMTVDHTMSGRVIVRARDEEEAHWRLREAAAAQYPHGFTLDDGNYRSAGDYYIGDNQVECISKVETESDGEHWGCATWRDERFEYRIDMSRVNADSSSERLWCKCEVSLIVARGTVKLEKTLKNFECHRSRLGAYLEEAVEEGYFEEDLDKLSAKLAKKLGLN